jgi:hypothetical protein
MPHALTSTDRKAYDRDGFRDVLLEDESEVASFLDL